MRGYLSGEALKQAYSSASIFVLPSWSEGFATVFAEAMDAGLPIVTTRIRGAADHLIDGENVLFIEPRDVTALASALRTLVEDSDLRARMGSANHERVHMFDPEVVAAEYRGVLEVVINQRSTFGRTRRSDGVSRARAHGTLDVHSGEEEVREARR